MKWSADASVGGKIGSLAHRLMESQSKRTIKQFFDCLRQKLE